MPAEEYDLTIIGSGPGGYVAAVRSAQLGMKTALIEKSETLGGTCLNIGCIPSKALLDSSELYAKVNHECSEHGIVCGEVSLNLAAMLKRKDKVVKQLTDGVAGLMKINRVSVFHGRGYLKDSHTVRIEGNETEIHTKYILLATGSTAQELPFLPVDGKTVVTSTEALSFTSVPEKLVVIGAGAIGLELGSVWSRLGSDVTVVEIMPQVLPGWDSELAGALEKELARQSMRIHLNTAVTGMEKKKGKAVLTAVTESKKEISLEGDKVLVAVGRRPYWDGLNIEGLGIELSKDGRHLKVNESWQTSLKSVYAVGDVIEGPMLAHKAEEEGIAATEVIAGKAGHVNYNTVPGVVYTWPEAAMVGETEEGLKSKGTAYSKGLFPFAANGRAVAMNDASGFVKILADSKYDKILGAHVLGPWASDLIAEIVAVMEFDGSAEDIARTVHSHPTLSEAVREAALGVDGRMIHIRNRKL